MNRTERSDAAAGTTDGADGRSIVLTFDDNRLLAELVGPHNAHLARLERLLAVVVASRGNQLTISGPAEAQERARAVLTALWQRLARGLAVGPADIDSAVRFSGRPAELPATDPPMAIRTRRRLVEAQSPNQASYMAALERSELVFALGPAGTGKTYLAVAYGVALLAVGSVSRLVLSRPAVEAGERLGFLPGDLKEKVDPYLRPLYDALFDTLPADQVHRSLDNGTIEVAPLAFMRGRTLDDSFIILDEAQNTTSMQMRMFLTRMGRASRMVVTGDPTQIDLKPGERSGLIEALEILEPVDGIACVRFADGDVVRHPLVGRIVAAYRRLDEGLPPAGSATGPAR